MQRFLAIQTAKSHEAAQLLFDVFGEFELDVAIFTSEVAYNLLADNRT